MLLYGGWSAEREISLRSGGAVEGAFNRSGLTFSHLDLKSPEEALDISNEFDVAFIALHGRGGEDMGFIQEILRIKGVLNLQAVTLKPVRPQ